MAPSAVSTAMHFQPPTAAAADPAADEQKAVDGGKLQKGGAFLSRAQSATISFHLSVAISFCLVKT